MTDGGPLSAADAEMAAALLAIDPVGLGGIALRGGWGPSREAWIQRLRDRFPRGAPARRAPLHIDDDRLLGGLDLAASLAVGARVAQAGVLAQCDGGLLILPMAERVEASTAAKLAATMDRRAVTVERDGLTLRQETRFAVLACDEGLADEEHPPAALLERLAFWIDGRVLGDETDAPPSPALCEDARARLPDVVGADDEILEALCAVAASVGVDSLRAPIMALRASRARAALFGRTSISPEDAAVAARLVLAPRALTAPADDTPAEQSPPPDSPPPDSHDDQTTTADDQANTPPKDIVVDAIRAALPQDLLQGLARDLGDRARSARGRGAGAAAKSAMRGRPVGSRAGRRRPGERLNLIETLRAAAPWQNLRNAGNPTDRVQVRRDDFRIRRFVQKRESTTIFVVDASGSAAVQRLAEAKGAVEQLLAKAYATRARVALVTFRGTEADVLLPPTRSLTRARRRLADLPGGGGTPLASGIETALGLALAERAMDRTPLLVFLTDGRANITLSGNPGREAAETDALAAAARVRAHGVASAYVDTSPRPRPGADRFARAMDAIYAPLPYLDSLAVAGVVDRLRATA